MYWQTPSRRWVGDSNRLFIELAPILFVLEQSKDLESMMKFLKFFDHEDIKYGLEGNNIAQLELFNGKVLHWENNLDGAREKYELAAGLTDNQIFKSDALSLLGEVSMNQSKHRDAIRYFERAIHLDKREENYGVIYRFLGECYLEVGDSLKGEKYFSKSIDVNRKLWQITSSLKNLEDLIQSEFLLLAQLNKRKPLFERFGLDAGLRRILKEGISALRDVRGGNPQDTSQLCRLLLLVCQEGKKIDSSFYSNQERMVSYLSRDR